MAKLSSPIIAPAYSIDDIEKKLNPIIALKNWGSFSIKSTKLILIPVYIFSYEAFKEEGKDNHKIVTASYKGKALFNAHTSKLELDNKIDIAKAGDDAPTIPFEILESHTDEVHIDSILSFNISKELKVQKDNIIVSNLKRVYLSELIVTVLIGDKTYTAKIDSLTGNISESIPVREKTFSELAKETVLELKEPKAWIDYPKAIIQDISGLFKTSNPLYFQLGFLLLIFVVLIWVALLQ